MTLTAKLIALASVAVMVVCAYYLGRMAERFDRWGKVVEAFLKGTSHG